MTSISERFAYPVRFAELTGLSATEIRRLCRQCILPNERTRKGFRIDVEAGLIALRERAATFVGHEMSRPVMSQIWIKPRQATGSGETGFLAALEALKGVQ